MFMILRFGLKNIDFLGKMKAKKFALLMCAKARGGYVPNHKRNHPRDCSVCLVVTYQIVNVTTLHDTLYRKRSQKAILF